MEQKRTTINLLATSVPKTIITVKWKYTYGLQRMCMLLMKKEKDCSHNKGNIQTEEIIIFI